MDRHIAVSDVLPTVDSSAGEVERPQLSSRLADLIVRDCIESLRLEGIEVTYEEAAAALERSQERPIIDIG